MKKTPTQGCFIKTPALLLVLLGFAGTACAQSSVWTNKLGGSWAAAANWTNGVIASGATNTADFSQLTLAAAPTVTLDGARTNGTLIFGDGGNTYGWTLNTGTGGPLTLSQITVNGQATTVGAVLAGTNGFTKAGAGLLMLTGTPTYTGGTTISAGTLEMGAGATTLGTGTNTIAAGAELLVSNNLPNQGFGGTLAGSGTLDLVTGQPWFTWGTFSGPITVETAAQLRIYPAMNGNSALTVNGSGLVSVFSAFGTSSVKVSTLNSTSTTSEIRLGGGTSLYVMGGGNSSFAGNILTDAGGTGGIYKSGGGTLTLSGNNTFSPLVGTPAINLNGGILSLASTGAIGTSAASAISFAGGTLQYSAANTNDYSARFTNSAGQAYSINTGGQNVTFATALTSSGGSLTKTGNGTLTLAATNTYSGTTTVNGGILRGTGVIAGPTVVQSGGTLAAGTAAAVGALTIDNTLTLSTGGTNLLRINKTGGTAVSDQIQGLIGATYGGTLVVSNVTSDSTALASGDKFYLFPSAGSYAGGFVAFNLPALPSGLSWDTAGLTVDGSISVGSNLGVPIFSPASGGFVGAVTVTISGAAGSTIHYTTDGSNPTTSGTVISAASPVTGIVVPAGVVETINAYATEGGYGNSAVAAATYATVVTPTWTNPAGGSWPVAATWSNNIVGGGSGATADFSELTLSGTANVTLDGGAVIGNLIFGDAGNAYNWSVSTGSGGTLTLAGTNPPVITVANQTTTINALITGTNGLTLNGTGTLNLTARNTYSGVTTVNGGSLDLTMSTAYASGYVGSGVVVNSNATVEVNSLFALGYTANSADLTLNAGSTFYQADGTYVKNLTVVGGSTFTGTTDLRVGGNVTAVPTDAAIPALPELGLAGISYGVVGGVTTFTVSHDTNQTVDCTVGPIGQSSTAGLVKAGPGLLELTASNSYTGATIVSNGTLLVTGSLAGGNVTVLNGAELAASGTIGGATAVQSGGTLMTGTAGISLLTIKGNLTLAGNVNLRINSGSATGDLLTGMAGVTFGGTLTVTDLGGALAYGQTYTLFTLGSGTYAGSFASVSLPTPPSGLTWDTSHLAANGSIQLVYANQLAAPLFSPAAGGYVGSVPVTISAAAGSTIHYTLDGSNPTNSGTVISAASPVTVTIPDGTNLTINAYATKSGNANSLVASATYSTLPEAVWTNPAGGSWPVAANWSNNIVGSGNGVTADFSQLTLSGTANVTLDGGVTVGNLVFGDAGDSYNWTVSTGTGGTLTLADMNSQPDITVENQTATINALITGTNGFVFNGPGTLALTAQNSYSGTTMVNSGVLDLAMALNYSASKAGSAVVVASGATVEINGAFALGYTTAAANLTLDDGSTLVMADQTYINDFTITGAASLTGSDVDLRVSGNVTSVATDTAVPVIPALALAGVTYGNVGGTTMFTVNHDTNQAVDLTVGAIVQQSTAGLLKAGPGIMELTGVNTYAGGTTVSNGTLLVSSTGSLAKGGVTVLAGAVLGGSGVIGGATTIQSGGTVMTDPDGISTLTVSNAVDLAGTATLRIDSDTLSNDQLAGTNITYGGTLTVTDLGSSLVLGNSFQLFSAAGFAGNFATLNLPALGAGLAWSWTPANGTLTVVSTAPPTLSGITQLGDGNFSLTFSGTAGAGYSILATTNLTTPLAGWTVLSTGVFGGSPVTYSDLAATNYPARFYTIMVP